MDFDCSRRISRREFLKRSGTGLAAVTVAGMVPGPLFMDKPVLAEEILQPSIRIEPNPVLRVLRWNAFVRDEEDIWLQNTRRWEKLTGGRVETDFLPWEDVRPKAAMEAIIGAGHDIVLGWFDDPHLYPDKLLDLSESATYLGKKYGGWYPICETYGRIAGTGRWIGLPIGIGGQCMNFRISRVREAGFETVPADIEGFLKCCKALKAKGHYTGFPLGHAVGDANIWTHWWLWSFGGKAVESDGKTIAINSKETIQALNTARELFETMIPGVEHWLDPDNNKAFLDGNISLTNNGSSIVYSAQRDYPKIDADLAVTNLPVGPTGRPTELSLMSVAFIFNHTSAPNAARHYLTFMFEAEQYGNWIGGSWGYLTQALKHFHDLPAWVQDPRITPYRECTARSLWNGYAGPLGVVSAATMSEYIIVDMFADACSRRRTSQQAALAAEAKLARLFSQASGIRHG